MLRSLVLILLLVNAAFYAWSHGWLNQLVGVRPDSQHEPQRMARQINPDKIVVLPPVGQQNAGAGKHAGEPAGAAASTASGAATASAASAASSAAQTATSAAPGSSVPQPAAASSAPSVAGAAAMPGKDTRCVEAGPFTPAEYAALENNLRPILPAGSWGSHTVAIQGLWLVYMGPYADADMLERKEIELRRIKGLNFEQVRTPANLAMGLSLGRYTQLDEATAGLNALRNRGIRTARIVNIRPSMEVQVLRVPQASVSMQVSLASLKLPPGKEFSACRP